VTTFGTRSLQERSLNTSSFPPARGRRDNKRSIGKSKGLGPSVKESGPRGHKNIIATGQLRMSIACGRSVKMQSVGEKIVFCSCHNSVTQRTSAVSENAIGKWTVRAVSPIEYRHVP